MFFTLCVIICLIKHRFKYRKILIISGDVKMLKNYYEVDENESVGSFLKEINDKKNMQYIILDTNPKAFVDVRTVALRMHNKNEKLKSLKKPLSISKGSLKEDFLKHLIDSGDRVIEANNDYFDFIDALEYIFQKGYDFLDEKLENSARKEIYALNEDDMISSARRFFTQKRVNLLPVISKINLVGEVRIMDLLVNDFLNQKNDNRGNLYDENYKNSIYNLPVSNIMNKRPLTIDKTKTLGDAVELMINKKIPSLIITEDDKLYSIISYKDIFKMVVTNLENDLYNIEYTGSGDLYDDEYDLIQDFSEKFMKRISKVSGYRLLKMSFKVHGNTEGTHQKKASVTLTLSEGNKVLHVSKEMVGGTSDELSNDKVKAKWNIPLMVSDSLKALEKKVIEEKRKAK